jgi:uncharacterized membrane protein YagU involved in acid resistance
MSSIHLIIEAAMVLPLAGGDLIGFAGDKVNAVGVLLRSFSVVAGIGFVIVQAIMSRGAMARIVVSGLAAALFIWIVFNVTDLQDRVDNEMGTASVPAAVASQPTA